MATLALSMGAEETLRERVADQFGAIRSWSAVGATGRTRVIRLDHERIVIKPFPSRRALDRARDLMGTVHAAGVRVPAVIDAWQISGVYVGVFEYIEGAPLTDVSLESPVWQSVFALIGRLDAIRATDDSAGIDDRWLARVSRTAHDADAIAVRAQLASGDAPTVRTLAHGDFAPQNLVSTPVALVPIDWEEVGYARAGFDAGWLLALNRFGAGPGWSRRHLWNQYRTAGLADADLVWSEGLGLLRLHFRVTTWARSDPRWVPRLALARRALRSYREEYAL